MIDLDISFILAGSKNVWNVSFGFKVIKCLSRTAYKSSLVINVR